MAVIYMEKLSIESITEKDIKDLIDKYHNVKDYGKFKNYYEGNHPILDHTKRENFSPNNQIVNNMAKYVTDTAVGYFIGKPIIYSSIDTELLEKITEIFEYNDEQDHNTEIAKKNSIYGSCYEMIYLDEDGKIRFHYIEPNNLIMIYATGNIEPTSAIRVIYSNNKKGELIKKVEYYTSSDIYYFQIQNDKLELQSIEPHYFQEIPFIEFINNEERRGDFEDIITLIDAYNKVQSNTANLFEYNDEAILKISKLGDVSTKDVRDMKQKGAIILEDGGEIDWLVKQIDDTSIENYKKRLREDMHIFTNIPNMTDESFGGSSLSGVAISYKLWGLEQVCAIKERKFKKAIQRRIELIVNILNLKGGNYNYMDLKLHFRRNKPQDLLELAQITTMLSSELSRETRLKLLPLVENVQDEIDKLEREKQSDLNGFGNNYDNFIKAFDTTDIDKEAFVE